MQTYTHFLWAYILFRPLIAELPASAPPPRLSAVLFGSVLPDLPLILTTIVCFIVDRVEQDNGHFIHLLFSQWYFHNPYVKAEHNLFHSPITLCTMISTIYYIYSRSRRERVASVSAWFFWVLCSAMFHATCDIPVHHDDGPLLLFPFNWEYRFRSPLSYWDPNYHGREFSTGEHILDAIILLVMLRRCCCERSRPSIGNDDSASNGNKPVELEDLVTRDQHRTQLEYQDGERA